MFQPICKFQVVKLLPWKKTTFKKKIITVIIIIIIIIIIKNSPEIKMPIHYRL